MGHRQTNSNWRVCAHLRIVCSRMPCTYCLPGRHRTAQPDAKRNARLPISCSQSGRKKLAAAVIWSDILTRNNKITSEKRGKNMKIKNSRSNMYDHFAFNHFHGDSTPSRRQCDDGHGYCCCCCCGRLAWLMIMIWYVRQGLWTFMLEYRLVIFLPHAPDSISLRRAAHRN